MLNRQITYNDQSIETLAEQFLRFADKEAREAGCDLYEHLSHCIAADPTILEISLSTPHGQPAANMLFAAVQFLLFSGVNHALQTFYPNLVSAPEPVGEVFPVFAAFCAEHRQRLKAIIAERSVQTNEVLRCASFFPVFSWVSQQLHHQPFHLIDVGASAGLHLLWDRYGYRYGDDFQINPDDTTLVLSCDLRGDKIPPVSAEFPAILSQIGIDINAIDVRNQEAMRWLRAFIFPSHSERFERFDAAVKIAQAAPPRIIDGDALVVLPELIEAFDPQDPICLLFSFSSYQMFRNGRADLIRFLTDLSQGRRIIEVSFGHFGHAVPRLIVSNYMNGMVDERTVATAHIHGKWIEWLLDEQPTD